jgi:threonylcarbamoyladenosine tRNA methylthiotransferase MtaB
MFRVRCHTIGCRLNQLETEALASAFRAVPGRFASLDAIGSRSPARGRDDPAIHIVNTCTVTSMAEQKARRLIRSILASEPRSIVVATGCYAEVSPRSLTELGDRVVAVPVSRKASLLALPAAIDAAAKERGGLALDLGEIARDALSAIEGQAADRFAFSPAEFESRARASLKVQDGCDNACAYCLVRVARGPSSSLEPERAVERAVALERAGIGEIVLTGVNLSQYSSGGIGFPGLLGELLRATSSTRFRVSSYEPDRVDDAFLSVFSHSRICAFSHLAAQSLCDATLARMRRKYRAATVVEAVRALRSAKDRPYIGFDLIAGFPGESDVEFDETIAGVDACRPAGIHPFPYSPRPGTEADAMRPRVPERIAGARVAALAERAEAGMRAYLAECDGMETTAVAESGGRATTDNYLHVEIAGNGVPARGRSFRCRVDASGGQVRACFLGYLR